MSYAECLEVDTNLTYCPNTLTVSKPLKITNVSEHELAFKIKTNKKNLVSMNPCNGFIKPFYTIQIPVKIVQNVPENISVKLEVDWCYVTAEMRQKNDIKMATATDKDIYKKIFPIVRKQQKPTNTQIGFQQSKSLYQSLHVSKRAEKEENKITPFEYENKEVEQKHEQKTNKSLDKPVERTVEKPLEKSIERSVDRLNQKLPEKLAESVKQEFKNQEQKSDSSGQYHSANLMLKSQSSPTNNLQIVSQEDEEDHEKQLEHIRSQQVQELRAIDEIKSRIRKARHQVKSTEIIDSKLLLLSLASSFLVGSFLQYLIF